MRHDISLRHFIKHLMGNSRSTPMQPSDTEFGIWVNEHHQGSIKRKDQNFISENVIELSSSDSEDENTQSCNDFNQQLVLYNPFVNHGLPTIEDENIPSCNGSHQQLVLYAPFVNGSNLVSYKAPPVKRVLPSIGAYTVQCANCLKWRFIPTQEKYEEIREHITEKPFVCETAHEWRPDVSCYDPPDIEQDGSRLWAIDKPNIVQTPPGWQRNLRIRAAGGTKFADIYYVPPTGAKVLRSITDVERYLIEHPEYMEQGVTLAQFSFTIPKPLEENYVRKRPSRAYALQDDNCMRFPHPPPAFAMSLPDPGAITDLQLDLNPTPKRARTASGNQRQVSSWM